MKSVIRIVVVFAIVLGVLWSLSQFLRIAPTWPLWMPAAGMALAVEAIISLYRYERGAVTARRGHWILGLRLAAAALLLWILLEPTLVRKITREQQRQLVVVIDDSASMHLKDDGEERTRIELAEEALAQTKLVEQLSQTMKVRTIRAARSVREGAEVMPDGWADATDLSAALGHVLEQVPPDELAGVVLVSDGRHNRPERVEDVARRFGILDAPIGVLAMGSEIPPRDASLLSVSAPEAIHLGDRMRIAVKVKFDGYKGEKARVLWKRGDKLIETREITIPQDHHREELRFVHLPEEGGVGDYRVEIAPMEKERFDDNNGWDFETSITDARTNVLLIDSHPRWEFRYLRNLFYGRDKSVHLQYMLLHPDTITGEESPAVAASAARPFGEAQATRLPASEEEWRKFDVIILGDIEPGAIDEATWKIISRCVNDRAALLVMIAGPRYMPHALGVAEARNLVPAEMNWGAENYYDRSSKEFRWSLTTEGQNHIVTQQSSGESSNEQMWAGFPAITWRHPINGIREGAEILLTSATPQVRDSTSSGADLTRALGDLAKRRQQEIESALLVTRQTGKGKVALLLTDRTWRLREGAGDVFHHRFWGNLVRWGAGPTLRAGAKQLRLGSDQLTYTPDDPIVVTARLRDASMAPVEKASLSAEILAEGKVISTVALSDAGEGNGLYQATLPAMAHAGRYEIRLRGDAADIAMKGDGLSEVQTSFRIVGSRGPVELAETSLNLPLLETVATLSGGKVVKTAKTAELAGLFLRNKAEKEEVREISLWDHAWVLILLALCLASEWILRRAGGLP